MLLACITTIAMVEGSAFHDAIAADDAVQLKKLIETFPGGLNEPDDNGGQTPLMNAVLSGKTEAVRTLLAAGADTSIGERDGYTPMHGAGFQGRAEIAKILVDHGLNPSDRHPDGFTPIHRACWGKEKRHTDTVKVLLEAGVHPEEPSGRGDTPVKMTQNEKTRELLHYYTHKDRPIPGAGNIKAEL